MTVVSTLRGRGQGQTRALASGGQWMAPLTVNTVEAQVRSAA